MAKQANWADLIRKRINADPRSVYRIAADAGIAVQIVQRFDKGERSIRIDTAEKLGRVLGLDLVVKG